MNTQSLNTLEFNKIKEEVANFTLTDSGKENMLALEPSVHMKQIETWLEEVSEAVNILNISSSVPIHALDGIQTTLKHLNKGVPLRVEQLNKLLHFLDCCRKLKQFMKNKDFVAPRVSSYVYSIEEIPELADEIQRCIRNGLIDDYASKNLLSIRKQITIQEDRLKEKIDSIVKSKKYKSYLQEAIVSQRGGRYVVPVRKEYKNKVPGTVLDSSASGSTLYIEPSELNYQHEQLLALKFEEDMEIQNILWMLTGLVQQHEKTLHLAVETMIQYDVIFAKAKYSKSIDGRKVKVNQHHYISLKNARHPLLGNNAVPLTVEIGKDFHALVITGPNTGGKTVTIKTVGLLTLMVQSGLHIPVDEDSEISIFHQILVDIGDGQSLEQNLSTFSSHIKNIISILTDSHDRTLVLLDELGSGTDPSEGMGLATAILGQLYHKGVTMIATTHYSEIKQFAEEHEGFINGSMEFDLESLKPTYRLLIGKGGDSQAFSIALRLGMHPSIIEKAHKITYGEDKTYSIDEEFVQNKTLLDKQIITNRYAVRDRKPSYKKQENITMYQKGDNVKISQTDELGIIFKGPDRMGNFIVQIKGEKKEVNHKRLELYIAANELYPEDYDFGIVFESKEFRKKDKILSKRHDENIVIDIESS